MSFYNVRGVFFYLSVDTSHKSKQRIGDSVEIISLYRFVLTSYHPENDPHQPVRFRFTLCYEDKVLHMSWVYGVSSLQSQCK